MLREPPQHTGTDAGPTGATRTGACYQGWTTGPTVPAVFMYGYLYLSLNIQFTYKEVIQLQNYPSDDCGAYAFGNYTTDHAAAGLFDDAAVTVWYRGSTAEVIWKTGAKHRGWY